MNPILSVVICTHNPRADFLHATLEGLRRQETVVEHDWELIVVDNASQPPLSHDTDLSWHPSARIVREEHLGLTHARQRGFQEARGETLVFVDDDNVLCPDYLRSAQLTLQEDSSLGAIGGRSIPVFEAPPPDWFHGLGVDLACRDLGDLPQYASWTDSVRSYPECAPIGAGLVVRRTVFATYLAAARGDSARMTLGRRGSDLASGEDNDLVMTLLGLGWRVAYLPSLRLDHLIPAARLTREYLANYAFSGSRTWVRVLDVHGIRPWRPISPWTARLRMARAYARERAWRDDASFIRWRGACGLLSGRAQLSRRGTA